MNFLEQLKKQTKVVADASDIDAIRRFTEYKQAGQYFMTKN
jgi:hypothetical protein